MSGPHDDHWDEEDAGPVVRLYALTRGRGRTSRSDLTLDTMVVDTAPGLAPRRSEPEYVDIVGLCRVPQSVAEVSAQLGVPLTLTKVLIGDLVDDGRLIVRAPADTGDDADLGLLQMIANSLRGS
ncbi:DUF742 domain-containing protein [Nocardia sp. NBC_00416]|uniref:DUF742 domain-containing protein n=1 Tax=Nocardia sp. NBC_00416 TaxID=2975991 RepID=UPI002E22920D